MTDSVEDFEDFHDVNLERCDDPDADDSIRFLNTSDEKIVTTPSINLPSEVVAQNTTNYAVLTVEQLVDYSETELEKINAEAVSKFNMKPKSVREFLISHKVIQGLPSEIAKFIFNQSKLSKRRIGEYIGNADAYNQSGRFYINKPFIFYLILKIL